jgi:hypothetical protein
MWEVLNLEQKEFELEFNLALLVEARTYYLRTLFEERKNYAEFSACRQRLEELCASLETIAKNEPFYLSYLLDGYAGIAITFDSDNIEDSAARRYYIEKFFTFEEYYHGSFKFFKARANLLRSLGILYEREGNLEQALNIHRLTIRMINDLHEQSLDYFCLSELTSTQFHHIRIKQKLGDCEDIGTEYLILSDLYLHALVLNPTVDEAITQVLTHRQLAEACAQIGQAGWAYLLAARQNALAKKTLEALGNAEDEKWLAEAEAFAQKYPLPAGFVYDDFDAPEAYEQMLEAGFPKILY